MNSENVKDKDSKVSFNSDIFKNWQTNQNKSNPQIFSNRQDIYQKQMSQVEYLAKIIDALSLATGESLAVKPGDPLIH